MQICFLVLDRFNVNGINECTVGNFANKQLKICAVLFMCGCCKRRVSRAAAQGANL